MGKWSLFYLSVFQLTSPAFSFVQSNEFLIPFLYPSVLEIPFDYFVYISVSSSECLYPVIYFLGHVIKVRITIIFLGIFSIAIFPSLAVYLGLGFCPSHFQIKSQSLSISNGRDSI